MMSQLQFTLSLSSLYLVLFAILVAGQLLYQGPCHVVQEQTEPHVNILGLLGPWYQQNRIRNSHERGICSSTFFSVGNLETGMVINREFVDGFPRFMNGTIVKDEDYPHRYIVTYGTMKYDYYFLSVNYREYVLIYSCRSNGNRTRNVWGWLLSRKKDYKPSRQSVKEIRVALELNPDLNVTWTPAQQKECRY